MCGCVSDRLGLPLLCLLCVSSLGLENLGVISSNLYVRAHKGEQRVLSSWKISCGRQLEDLVCDGLLLLLCYK